VCARSSPIPKGVAILCLPSDIAVIVDPWFVVFEFEHVTAYDSSTARQYDRMDVRRSAAREDSERTFSRADHG